MNVASGKSAVLLAMREVRASGMTSEDKRSVLQGLCEQLKQPEHREVGGTPVEVQMEDPFTVHLVNGMKTSRAGTTGEVVSLD